MATTANAANVVKRGITRAIFRWIHIVFAIPILGYIYSPFDKLPSYAFDPVCLRSCNGPFGIVDVERPRRSATDFETIGGWHGRVLAPVIYDRRMTTFGKADYPRMKTMANVTLSRKQREEILGALKARFEKNMNRHQGLEWAQVQAKLEAAAEKLWSLNEMERTGGEPDVVGHDKKTGEYIFYDCSAESPKGRRSICYDREALESRKEHKPKDSAIGMAAAMGIELLTEEQYRELQKLGNFDTKTSSWVKTPPDIKILGGALFCDRRYDTVFVYHNGAESYYAARGFRGLLRV